MALQVLLHLFLAVVWMGLQGRPTARDLLVGLVLGGAALHLFRRRGAELYLGRLWAGIALLGVFLKELVKANVTVARLVLSPRLRITPGIIALPLRVKSDAAVTLLANLITLTPGTLSLDVSPDRSCLYVHVLNLTDPQGTKDELASAFERRILDLGG